MNNGLYSLPFYPSFVGVEIPFGSKHGKTSVTHALLMGAIIQHNGKRGEGCFASEELLAEEIMVKQESVKRYLKDLENLGWVEVERDANKRYKKAFPNMDIVIGVVCSHGNKRVFPREQGCVPTGTNVTPVTTPDLNNNIINNKKSSRLRSMTPLSSVVNEEESPTPPDFSGVVDLKKVKKSAPNYGKMAAALLTESGKQGVVTAGVIRVVKLRVEQYGQKAVFDVVRKAKFDKFYAEMGLQTLLAEKNFENILNKDNEVKDHHPESHSTGIRREI